ncbi:MAG: amidohydrolase [Clostridia bacterium]|nr:amidohydrolase [Clostridia bacterium]
MDILGMIRPYVQQMLEDRRYLHEHPELSGAETQTIAFVSRALEELGFRLHVVPSGGVIGVMNRAGDAPYVLLRADVDALPIQESERNLLELRACVSKNPGVMHACGHDAHTAMLLCAARALAASEAPMNALFVFEQGEEKGGKGFIENLLPYIEENFSVGTCYATHVRWDIPAGKIAVMDGVVMAGGFGFDVTIRGRGGHGSRPDLACSPIDCFCDIHQQASALRMRVAEPDSVLTYSLGLVHAGEQQNIIPGSLRFAGTVRTYDTAGAAERFASGLRAVIDHACAVHGCEYTLDHFSKPIYETANDPQAAAHARRAIGGALGEDAVTACVPWMASESMSAYLKLWPGVLSFTGIRNEKKGCGANHHTPEFDLDEDALALGAAAACAYAIDYAENRPEYAFCRKIVSVADLVSRTL